MKKIILILTVTILAACTDLEVAPKDSLLEGVVFSNPDNYTGYLAKIYASFSNTGQQGPDGDTDLNIISDEGFTSYIRAYWKGQELTTDEAVIGWSDAGVRDLHNHAWSSENQFIRVLYYRIMYTVVLVNDFLRVSTDEMLALNGIESQNHADIAQYRAEVRFLRALAYYHAIDFFRNVPLVTSVSTELPEQASPQALFDFILAELNEIESTLPDPMEAEYGRADKAAIWMLRAKMYLNAGVFTGTDMFDQCLAECEKVLGAGYTLATDYQHNFRADNHTSPELIFTFPSDGDNSQNWGSTTFLVHGAIGGSMTDTDYGVVNGWAGMRTTSAFVALFSDISGATDSRAIFYTAGQDLEIAELGDFTDGYAVPKYTNLDANGLAGANTTHVDTDYPVFRLADAMLMYVESHLRGGGGDAGTALGYVNELRTRAYGDNTGNITAGDLNLDFVLDERSRELYWEGYRRQDLIRFETFTTAGIWPWKGGVPEGKLTEDFRDIFPIPASDLTANPNLVQNTGY